MDHDLAIEHVETRPWLHHVFGHGSSIDELREAARIIPGKTFLLWSAEPIQILDSPCRFTDIIPADGALPVAALIVSPQSKRAGSSDAPEPLSSNDVAATMALNGARGAAGPARHKRCSKGAPPTGRLTTRLPSPRLASA